MRELQAQMKAFEQEIQELQANPQLKAELAFESELRELLKTHGKTIHEAVQTVDPSFQIVVRGKKAVTRPRDEHGNLIPGKSKKAGPNTVWYAFKNPHTGEVVRAANILKKEVKEWIGQYGKDTVISWRTPAPAE